MIGALRKRYRVTIARQELIRCVMLPVARDALVPGRVTGLTSLMPAAKRMETDRYHLYAV